MGISFRQDAASALVVGQMLYLVSEPENPFDPNALAIYADVERTKQLGYVMKDLARDLSAQGKLGWKYECVVSDLTGGPKQTRGVNIKIIARREGEGI
jgi:hypothetical protein